MDVVPASFVIEKLPGARPATLKQPHGMFATDELLYFTDYRHNRLVIYPLSNSEGDSPMIVASLPRKFLDPSNLPLDIYRKRINPKRLYFPAHVWATSDRVLLTDLGNNRLLIYPGRMPSEKQRPQILDRFQAPSGNNCFNRYFPDGIQCFHKHTILRQSRL